MANNNASSLLRRDFLRRAGLMGAGAYFLPSLLPRIAQAQAKPPRRVLFFMTGHANPYPDWKMRRSGLPEQGEWEFELGSMSASEFSPNYAPLHPFRNKLMFLDTLSNPVPIEVRGGAGGHFNGPSSLLTGSTIEDDKQAMALGRSVDQLIAEKTLVAGGIRSLELGFGRPYPFVWAGPGNALPVRSAAQAFESVFAGRNLGPTVAQPPVTMGGSSAPLTRDERILLARRRILEHTQSRYRNLASHISVEERARLESHADLIGDLALTLADPSGLGGTDDGPVTPVVSEGCYQPQRPADSNYTQHVKALGELVAVAFACDITRVASIQLAQMATADFGGPGGADVHQDVAHHGDESSESYRNMCKYYLKHSEHFASVLSALDAISEPDGSRLLDNTIVMWVPECGSWVHQTTHLPVVLAGGGGFRMGRYLRMGNIDPVSSGGGNAGEQYRNVGPSIARLNVSIANQMGVNINQIGDLTSSRGVSMTGPLDRLV